MGLAPVLADWNARLAILLVARIGERGSADDVVACVQAARTAYGAWDPSAPQRQQFRQVLDRAEQYELRRSLGLPLNVDARRRLYQLTRSEADLLAWIATIKRLEKEAKGDGSASAAASYERAVAHYMLFTDLHDQKALNAAIICANSAVFKVPESKEYRALAVRLLTARYSEKLREHDLKVGLRLAEPIMDLPDVQRDLGVLLLGRYTEHSDRADLERAAAAFAAAVRSQESPVERAGLRLLLARAFFLEFLLTADASTLDAAIAAPAEALAELPDGDLRTEILLEESKLRCDRFQRTGQLADVERAEAAAREALSRSPQGDRWHTMAVIELPPVRRPG